ncbi:S41 family peptidase [Kriegella aquimaris]|uniref:Peptidase family S41 n=1 Tax=Kriegella aquimaris TaxID=192904 RepID=A0A1G9S826_9FLAO|nr:S41 family peptidase [Kriegella aquimaris]SDM31604.1 Peptidase family S41 [Kriegella aquimaris]
MKKILYLGTFLLSAALGAQKLPILNPNELQNDFHFFRTALEEAHPGLYRYTSKAQMDTHFKSIQNSLKTPLSEQEFYKKLLPLISEIGCGHTKLLPPKIDTYNYYYNTQTLFPLQLFFEGDTAYAVSSYGKEMPFKPNTQILAINGEGMKKIVEKLKKTLFSDGRNTTFKYYEINKFFNGLYGNIITNVENPPNRFIVDYLEDEIEKTVTLNPVTLEEIKAKQQNENPETPFQLEITEDHKTAVMTIISFWPDDKSNFKNFLKSSFTEIRANEVENLILDLRNNEGGKDAYGALLLSYLVDKSFSYYDRLEAVTDKKFSFHEHARLPKFYGLMRGMLSKNDNGKYLWKKNKNLKIQKPQNNPFLGKVIVLINGGSFSVTSEFAAVAHHLKRAVFIGEETGGGYHGNNSGAFAIVKLPNSKIDLGIPLLAYYTAVGDYAFKDQGVIPDYEVRPTIEGKLFKKDEVMERAMEILKENTESRQLVFKTDL